MTTDTRDPKEPVRHFDINQIPEGTLTDSEVEAKVRFAISALADVYKNGKRPFIRVMEKLENTENDLARMAYGLMERFTYVKGQKEMAGISVKINEAIKNAIKDVPELKGIEVDHEVVSMPGGSSNDALKNLIKSILKSRE